MACTYLINLKTHLFLSRTSSMSAQCYKYILGRRDLNY